MDQDMKSEFSKIHGELAEINKRLNGHDENFVSIAQRFQQMDQRFERIDRKFERVDAEFRMVHASFNVIHKEMHNDRLRAEAHYAEFKVALDAIRENQQVIRRLYPLETAMAHHEVRISALEDAVSKS